MSDSVGASSHATRIGVARKKGTFGGSRYGGERGSRRSRIHHPAAEAVGGRTSDCGVCRGTEYDRIVGAGEVRRNGHVH